MDWTPTTNDTDQNQHTALTHLVGHYSTPVITAR
jgi:hypothetical protein